MTCISKGDEKYRDQRFSTKREKKKKYKNNWKFEVKLPCSLFKQTDLAKYSGSLTQKRSYEHNLYILYPKHQSFN